MFDADQFSELFNFISSVLHNIVMEAWYERLIWLNLLINMLFNNECVQRKCEYSTKNRFWFDQDL